MHVTVVALTVRPIQMAVNGYARVALSISSCACVNRWVFIERPGRLICVGESK
jgi:hypothetical protein